MAVIPNLQELQIPLNGISSYSTLDHNPIADVSTTTSSNKGKIIITNLGHDASRKYKYSVISLEGRSLIHGNIQAGETKELDLSKLAIGQYFLLMETDTRNSIKRIFNAQ
ncbi:MAG: hypothetical protein IT267_08610 [Saprospiraceae bacterium]|nr:hypothetical protein [Saprospiraceae bacterium]